MRKGLDEFLNRIERDPKQKVLVTRFLALLQDMEDGFDKGRKLLRLASILKSTDNPLALQLAHQVFSHWRDPATGDMGVLNLEALRVMREVFQSAGRHAKVAVIDQEIKKLESHIKEDDSDDQGVHGNFRHGDEVSIRMKDLVDAQLNAMGRFPLTEFPDLPLFRAASGPEKPPIPEVTIISKVSAAAPPDIPRPDQFSMPMDLPEIPSEMADPVVVDLTTSRTIPVMDYQSMNPGRPLPIEISEVEDIPNQVPKPLEQAQVEQFNSEVIPSPLSEAAPAFEMQSSPSSPMPAPSQEDADFSPIPTRSRETQPIPSKFADKKPNSTAPRKAKSAAQVHRSPDPEIENFRNQVRANQQGSHIQVADLKELAVMMEGIIKKEILAETRQMVEASLLEENRRLQAAKEMRQQRTNSSEFSRLESTAISPEPHERGAENVSEIQRVLSYLQRVSESISPKISAGFARDRLMEAGYREGWPLNARRCSEIVELFRDRKISAERLQLRVLKILWRDLTPPAFEALARRAIVQEPLENLWGLYLDLYIDQGRDRDALWEIRQVITEKSRLTWVRQAWSRLPTIWEHLKVRGFEWAEEDGVVAFYQRLQVREEPTFTSLRSS